MTRITFKFLKERWHLIVVLILIIIGSITAGDFYSKYGNAEEGILEQIGFHLHDSAKKSQYFIGIEEKDRPPLLIYENGTPTGLDIDLIMWIADEIDINISFVPMPWHSVFNALRNEEIDMIMSGASITPEREMEFLFSEPYLSIEQAIAVSKNSNLSLNDFYTGQGIIGVEAGTTSESLVFNTLVVPDVISESMVHQFIGIRMGAEAISKNEIDFLMTDWPTMESLTHEYPIVIIGSISTGEEYGIAFRKDNIGLQQTVNTGLKKLLSSPEWEEIKLKYLTNTS